MKKTRSKKCRDTVPLMLLVAGVTVVACVTAIACIQSVAGILDLIVIFFSYRTIVISNIILANSRNYRTIGFQIKASIYRTIGYRTQKKLSAARPISGY